MHRFILSAPAGTEVDHVNHDTLDNRRCNLRIATKSQNLGNMRNSQAGSSRYKEVHWNATCKKWAIHVANKHYGIFDDEERAALQYDRAALEVYGDFAYLNFPERRSTTQELPLKVEPVYT